MVSAKTGRAFFRCLMTPLWCALFMLPVLADAGEAVKIGILAYRSKPQTLAQWQPLAVALKRAIPDKDFVIEAFEFDELALTVASRQVDFVLTNPGNYIQLSKRNGLSAPLATLALNDRNADHAIMVSGGVIFCRADYGGVKTLRDLKGKTIAAIGTESLGGYQFQAYEFQKLNGNLVDKAKLLFTGLPQDNVVNAVLNRQASVGFVRTGVLEEMAREGKLDIQQIKIINRQQLPDYPQLLSTRLYPEWPFAAMPQIDENLARHVAAALFMLEEQKSIMQAIGIHGFGVPADYTSVADLLREMRMPPYDVVPSFTLKDIWLRYQWALLMTLLIIGLFLLLTLKLLMVKRKLVVQQKLLLKQKQQLVESETFLRTLIRTLPDLIWLKNAEGVYLACNPRFEGFFGAEEQVIVGKTDYDFVDRDVADSFRAQDLLTMQKDAPVLSERWVSFLGDGHRELLEIRKIPMRNAAGEFVGVLGIGHDITKRKQAEEKLRLAASVFTHAREGILITGVDGNIIDVNDTFTAITGYSREEVLNRNPRLLKSDRQSKAFYTAMWADLTEKGEWSGELWNRRKNGQLYAEILTISAVRDAQGNTQHYVALFSDITPFKEYEQQLERIAHYDALTSLPNRILLADRLRLAMMQAQRRGLKVAVVFLDLDGFKAVNDTFGHDRGDELLMTLASRMKQALRESDTLARLGGDEFVAVLVDLPDADACLPLLSRLLTAASQPVISGELTMLVSASLGVSFYPQTEDIDADQLLRQADQAMYQAKLTGKNRYHLFDTDRDGSVRSLYESLEHIARALENREFVLHYQPKINMRTAEVVGVEALIRWQHPEKGLLSPASFLPVVENHPLSIEIGEWVIETALNQITEWQAAGLDMPVSVNVGARQLQQAGFVKRLQSTLAAHQTIRPGHLEIEMAENSALEDIGAVSQVVHACRDIGIQFTLDDFGTGYSSLTYLKHLPVCRLKIDQSFVRDMLDDADDLAILRGVIGLADTFKLGVIAEGVETRAQADSLLQLGCELAQGYGIAPPMPADDLPAWAASWRANPGW